MMLGLALSICAPSKPAASAPVTPEPVLVSRSYDVFDKAGGDSITLTGTDLDSATSVDVGGTSATITGNTSTTVTFTTPSVSAGAKDVTVTTSGGTSNALSIEAYDLAGLAFSGWWRAPYSGSPMTPTASAGASGSNGNLTEATNPPATGTAVNGYTPADLDGVNDKLTSVSTATNFLAAAAGTMLAFVNLDTVAANSASANLNAAILCNTNGSGYAILGVSASGLRGAVFDTQYRQPLAVACTTGAWHLVMLRWDSSNVEHSVDAGTASGTSCSALNSNVTLGNIRVGSNAAAGVFVDGKILELATAKVAIADSDLTKINTCFRCRYAQ